MKSEPQGGHCRPHLAGEGANGDAKDHGRERHENGIGNAGREQGSAHLDEWQKEERVAGAIDEAPVLIGFEVLLRELDGTLEVASFIPDKIGGMDADSKCSIEGEHEQEDPKREPMAGLFFEVCGRLHLVNVWKL